MFSPSAFDLAIAWKKNAMKKTHVYSHYQHMGTGLVACPPSQAEPQKLAQLPPGAFTMQMSSYGPFFDPLPLKGEPIFQLPCPAMPIVLDELSRFWAQRAHYQRYEVAHRRGILLYGPPGSGKSTTIREVSKDVISRGGLVTFMVNVDEFRQCLTGLRQIQPDLPIVMILEDLEELLSNYGESSILNLLDGFEDLDRIVFLATTNNLDALPPRIRNRPSRFDRKIYVGYPEADHRRLYLQHLDRFKVVTSDRLEHWVNSTAGMSLAHLKELFTSTVILDLPDDEVLSNLASMSHTEIINEEAADAEEDDDE